ncbi:uncharacterized protein MELLADRAFT_88720 [Melampsora larici-populina 98AG31]|uniref:Uncharacterized protein n=1 Tax=Melampsora larici-populina (strain 98AG31 / pathotype 3-4-7) TaxID=747676 RepID=F4SE73_MELLP|nr:uncharacterized protein MELLADRAFT_88720 [Melampsora larici-populina 98AG31]EGF97053.1 hypothetical protein MELLADRAFT_88720 [Melampsora larici-populina 98AG31]
MSIHSSNRKSNLSSTRPILSDSNSSTSDQEHIIHRLEEDHQFGGTHWLPLLFALIPSLGSLIHGDSESWTDTLLLILIGFILYKLTKVPWQIYASSRTTRILHQIKSDSNHLSSNPILHPKADLLGYTTELQKYELISLFMAIISPSLGILLLNIIQSKLKTSITLDYLNSNTIILFLLSSLIKPMGHLIGLLMNRTDYLQTKLHFPTDLMIELKKISGELKDQLNRLESNSISSYELSLLKTNYLENPIEKLTKTLSHQLDADQIRKTQITQECHELAKTLNRLESQLMKTKVDLNSLVLEQDQIKSNPIHTIAQMIIQLMTTVSQAEPLEAKVENRFENLDESDESDHDSDQTKVNPKKMNNIKHDENPPTDYKTREAEVEFIPTPLRSNVRVSPPKPSIKLRQWILYYLTIPILVWIKLMKTMILFPIELISNITKGEEYQRLSERNYQLDRAAYANHPNLGFDV